MRKLQVKLNPSSQVSWEWPLDTDDSHVDVEKILPHRWNRLLLRRFLISHSRSCFGSLITCYIWAVNAHPFTRYSTKFELFLNIIGLIAAVKLRSVNISFIPRDILMTLFSGNLMQQLVNFGPFFWHYSSKCRFRKSCRCHNSIS